MLSVRLRLCTAVLGSLLFALGAFACANQTKSGSDVVCERVMPTGSHIPRTYCWKASQAKERRENDREKLRNMQIGGGVNPNQDRPPPTTGF